MVLAGPQDLWLNDNRLEDREQLLDRVGEVGGTLTCLYAANNPATADVGDFRRRCLRVRWSCSPRSLACVRIRSNQGGSSHREPQADRVASSVCMPADRYQITCPTIATACDTMSTGCDPRLYLLPYCSMAQVLFKLEQLDDTMVAR